jgi:hypothetical protein
LQHQQPVTSEASFRGSCCLLRIITVLHVMKEEGRNVTARTCIVCLPTSLAPTDKTSRFHLNPFGQVTLTTHDVPRLTTLEAARSPSPSLPLRFPLSQVVCLPRCDSSEHVVVVGQHVSTRNLQDGLQSEPCLLPWSTPLQFINPRSNACVAYRIKDLACRIVMVAGNNK